MADFAQMMYGTAQNAAEQTGSGLVQGYAQGAALALKREELGKQQQELQVKRQQLEVAKYEKVGSWLEAANKMEGSMRDAFVNGYVTKGVAAMGLQDAIDPTVYKMMTKEPAVGNAMMTGIVNGKYSPAILSDADAVAKAYPELIAQASGQEIAAYASSNSQKIMKAYQETQDRVSREKVAQNRADQAVAGREGVQGRADRNNKTKLADKVTALGIPGLKNSLSSLDKNIPGGLDGWKPGTPIPGISGADAAIPMNRLKGTANKIRGDTVSVGNQIIKLRTGAAMSDGEALRLMSEIGIVPTIGEGGTWTGLAFKGSTSDENYINGMRRAKEILNSQEGVFRNAYGPEVYDEVVKPTNSAPAASGGIYRGKDAAWLQAFVRDNPKDPETPKIKAALKKAGY